MKTRNRTKFMQNICFGLLIITNILFIIISEICTIDVYSVRNFKQQQNHDINNDNDNDNDDNNENDIQFELPLDESYFLQRNKGKVLVYDGHIYHKTNTFNSKTYWRCKHAKRLRCPARITTTTNEIIITNLSHNHSPMNRLIYGMGENNVRKLNRIKNNV